MSDTIKLARYRNYGYTVNYNTMDGMYRTYLWSGSKNGKADIKAVPEEVVQYLMMDTTAFRDGELAIVEDSNKTKEIVDNLDPEYKNNSHSHEEVVKLLQGNTNKMKAELKKITNKEELRYVCDVAKEIKLDSNSKLAFLSKLMGMPQDILFAEDANK